MGSFSYRPDIDGLRALAVLPVLLFHAELGVPGGFVGVDVFFVISGYLITAILVRDIDAGTFRLADFWERRVRRIAPILLVVVAVALIAGLLLLVPRDLRRLGRSVAAQSSMSANIYFWLSGGYFGAAANTKPLLHLWSLAVEEQFYLLLPPILFALRGTSKRRVFACLLGLAAASLVLSIVWTNSFPWAAYFLLPARAWELLLGSLLALLLPRISLPQILRDFVGMSGLGLIGWSCFSYSDATSFPGANALAPCLGAALIIAAGAGRPALVSRLLSWRPLVYLGQTSYSLYLWHWPVLVYLQYWTIEPLTAVERGGGLVVAFLLAAASLAWIERPFRTRQVLAQRASLFWTAGAVSAALLVIGSLLGLGKGLPGRLPPVARAFAEGEQKMEFHHQVDLARARRGEFVPVSGPNNGPIHCLVWGDSHAMAAMPAFQQLGDRYTLRCVAATHNASAPLVGYKNRTPPSLMADSIPFAEALVDFVARERVRNVVLIAFWHSYHLADVDASESRLSMLLQDTVASLQKAGATVWVMRQVPQQKFNITDAIVRSAMYGRDNLHTSVSARDHESASALENRDISSLLSLGVHVLDPVPSLCDQNGRIPGVIGEERVYFDSDHLTTYGSLKLTSLFEPVFSRTASLGQQRLNQDSPTMTSDLARGSTQRANERRTDLNP